MAREPQGPTCRPGKPSRSQWRLSDRPVPALACACLFLATLIQPAGLYADEGRFEVRSATAHLQDGVWMVDARVDFQLSEEALEALDNGVALTFELQIEVIRVRRFWTNPEVASLSQSYELQYHALSQRYVLKNLNSGEQDSFSTLFAALNSLGHVLNLPVIDGSLIDLDSRYKIEIRAVLDQDRLPGPLQVFALWQDGFRLKSDWYGWTLGD